MSLKDKLQVYLITYNRKNKLKYTLEEILKSPIRDFDITVLDNNSTDGTTEIIQQYAQKFPNIKHIKHRVNIGGNANICRAFEMGASCGKKYFWVLCDDDKYDFSNWSEVENAINQDNDIICVADYIYPSGQKNNKSYQIFQLTFVPAGIYKSSLIDDKILISMYDNIYTMFQQSCPTIYTINNGGKIHVLSKPIVFNGLHFEDAEKNLSFIRGTEEKFVTERRRVTNWILGFSNVLTLLKDKKLREECMDTVIPYKDIYNSWENFYYACQKQYLSAEKFNYFFEIYKMLDSKRQQEYRRLYEHEIYNILVKLNFVIVGLNLVYVFWKMVWGFLSQIFSVKYFNNHLIITILGIKLKFKISTKSSSLKR